MTMTRPERRIAVFHAMCSAPLARTDLVRVAKAAVRVEAAFSHPEHEDAIAELEKFGNEPAEK